MKNGVKILGLLILLTHSVFAQKLPNPTYQRIVGSSSVQSKNTYLLTLMESIPEVKMLLEADPVFQEVAKAQRRRLEESLTDCGSDPLCYGKAILFSEQNIEEIAQHLKQMASNHKEIRRLVPDHLLPSGMYQLQYSPDFTEWLSNAWKQDAQTINHIIEVYAQGKKPNYPNIDSLGMKVTSKTFLANIQALNELEFVKSEGSQLFFKINLGYAMDALAMARMERAGDYEPLEHGENKAAFLKAKNVDWDAFEYPLILIPGAGTDNYLDQISPGSILRCQLAFEAYQKGMAPFIMVSGGNVHPYKVPNNEAEQMKKYLLQLGVPESSILMEPHARHTTTNLRNAARIMFRYGFPMDRASITVTTPSQSSYIYSEVMFDRSMKELGYHPYQNGKRLSNTIAEFYPQVISLQIDADEPLDP